MITHGKSLTACLICLFFLLSGFNSTETKIQTPDGKIWKEQEFHDLSREIYRDLSRQFAGNYTNKLLYDYYHSK